MSFRFCSIVHVKKKKKKNSHHELEKAQSFIPDALHSKVVEYLMEMIEDIFSSFCHLQQIPWAARPHPTRLIVDLWPEHKHPTLWGMVLVVVCAYGL